MSMILAAVSLTLTILILPSFWADTGQILGAQLSKYSNILPTIEVVGDWLAIILIVLAVLLIPYAFLQGKRIKDSMKKVFKNRLTLRRLSFQRK
jgi:hypothetical protein